MKINSMKLVGFRSHIKTSIVGLDRVNIFVGANGAGKSTILDAIGFALTGVTRGVDEGGKGADALACQLPTAAKTSTSVALQTDRGEILRGLGQGPKSQAHINIVTKLGLDQKILRVLSAPMNLLRLPAKKQEEIFFSMTGASVTTETIAKALTSGGIDLEATPVDLDDLLTPEGRSSKLDFWKKRRVEMKREIDSLVFTPSDQELPEADPEKRKKMEKEAAALIDRISRSNGALEQAVQSAKHFDELIAQEEAAIKSIKSEKGPTPVTPAEVKKMRAQIDEVNLWREEKAKKAGLLTASMTKKASIHDEAERIRALGRECSQCGQEISKAATEKKLESMRAIFTEISKETSGLGAEITALEKKINVVDVNALLTRINGAERAVEDRKRKLETLTKAEKTLADYQHRRKDILIPETQDTGEEVRHLAEIRQHIDLLKAAETEEGRQSSVNARRSEVEENLELMEKMLKAVGPGGTVQQAMAAGGTEEMVDRVRAIADKLGVGDVGIKLGPWQITLNGRDIELASASEEFRVAAAFGIAFAEKAGASIILLDGAEILRGDNRGLFQDLVFSTGLEQIFVAFASDSVPETSEAVEGLSMYAVTKLPSGESSVQPIRQEVTA